jgi:hypothetical protein
LALWLTQNPWRLAVSLARNRSNWTRMVALVAALLSGSGYRHWTVGGGPLRPSETFALP